jgi:acyl-coenzyme A thioesterase PaaI-like protein
VNSAAAGEVPFRLDAAARERALHLFNERGEIRWFGFDASLGDAIAEVRFASGVHRGLQGGGGTGAVNGGVIAAGFDAVAVLTGLGHYESDTVVTVDLSVQFLVLAQATPALAWRGWATRTTRSLCFVQAVLAAGDQVFASAHAIVKSV